jgi:hypothetical protein
MTTFTHEDLAAWAERKRVRAHLTEGRADRQRCACAGENCLVARPVADHLLACEDDAR